MTAFVWEVCLRNPIKYIHSTEWKSDGNNVIQMNRQTDSKYIKKSGEQIDELLSQTEHKSHGISLVAIHTAITHRNRNFNSIWQPSKLELFHFNVNMNTNQNRNELKKDSKLTHLIFNQFHALSSFLRNWRISLSHNIVSTFASHTIGNISQKLISVFTFTIFLFIHSPYPISWIKSPLNFGKNIKKIISREFLAQRKCHKCSMRRDRSVADMRSYSCASWSDHITNLMKLCSYSWSITGSASKLRKIPQIDCS